MTATDHDDAVFGEQRPVLFGLAYRMLGSVADAEDVVQEAYLRWQSSQREAIQSPRAFLTTVATRLAVDQLRRRQRERETYVGPWLPEPLVTDDAMQETRAELAESLSLAFLTLLEKLQPVERAVFLLHDVFQYSHDEIAAIVEKSPENCRQILARAKQHLAAGRPRFRPEPARQQELLQQFLVTCQSGDVPALVKMLVEDVVLTSDGGGKVPAAMVPIHGCDAVARMLCGLARKMPAGMVPKILSLNGLPALVLYEQGRAVHIVSLEMGADGRIVAIKVVRNPEKLTRIPAGGT